MARRPATPAILKGAILIAAPPWGRRSSHDPCEAAAPAASSLSPPHASSSSSSRPSPGTFLARHATTTRNHPLVLASPSSPSSPCSCSRSRNPSNRPLPRALPANQPPHARADPRAERRVSLLPPAPFLALTHLFPTLLPSPLRPKSNDRIPPIP